MKKSLFTPEEAHFAKCIGQINLSNPFLPDRIELEQKALGGNFVEFDAAWNALASQAKALTHPNIVAILRRSEALAENIRSRWPRDGRGITREEMTAYVSVAGFWLYHAHALQFDDLIRESEERSRLARQTSSKNTPLRPDLGIHFPACHEPLPAHALPRNQNRANYASRTFTVRRS